MTPEQFEQLMQAFDQLAGLPPQQREQLLAQWTGLDPAQREQLRRLLDADLHSAGRTARRIAPAALAPGMEPGTRIGPFLIEAAIGSGGMGDVFRARRCDGEIEQLAAIKLMRRERLDAATLARFRLERQVLALLRHPNIAAMLEIGELEPGQPFIAMEYIDGEPIDVHVRRLRADLRRRLELFLQVCGAVAYAHDNLIVHRDLKSSNILIGRDGQARLLDFGIAKPLTARLGGFEIEETRTAQRFFSLHNVAPEQLRGDPVTPACDVYGLGVLLYELLCEQPLFDFSQCSAAQAEALVLEQEPAPPGRRAEQAGPDYAGVPAAQLRGDLDAIVLRCLRKTPADRYRRVDDLVADIQAHLSARPVAARSGNLVYRSGRFLRRNRRALALAGVLCLAAGVGGYAYLSQHRATAVQRVRADRVTALILDALKSVDPARSRDRDVSAREVFERVAGQAVAEPALDADVRADLLLTVATIDNRIGAYREALGLLDRVTLPADDAARTEQAALQRVESLSALGNYAAAQELVRRHAPAAQAPATRAQWILAESGLELAQGRRAEALALLDKIDRAGLPPESLDEVRYVQADTAAAVGYYERGQEELDALLADQRARLPAHHPALLRTLLGLARLYGLMDRTAQAEALAAEAAVIAENLYGRRSLDYLNATSYVYARLSRNGEFAAAAAAMNEQIELSQEVLGADHPGTIGLHLNLAELYGRAGEKELADANYRKLIEAGDRVLQTADLRRLIFRLAYGVFLLRNERFADAGSVVAPALKTIEEHPRFLEYDVTPVLRFIAALSAYHAARTPANAAEVKTQLDEARTAEVSANARTSFDVLIKVAESLGVR